MSGGFVERIDTALGRMCKWMEACIALGLAVMVALVFSNVVLRYGFNSGIAVSEEISRWLFVWVIFIGAIVAARNHAHLGVDMVVSRLSRRGQKICLIVSHLGMLFLVGLLFKGAWEQVVLNWRVTAPVTGLSMAIVHLAALVFAVGMGALLLLDLFKLVTGRVADQDLVMVQESEEAEHLRKVLADADAEGRRRTTP